MDRSNHVRIFDTTLRDGEQALQASLSVKEKLQIALALERLHVDVMEVGFPASSPGDFESVQTIAREVKNSTVCALARAVHSDIDACAQSLSVAEHFRIHTFISTSTIHSQQKLRKSFDEIVEMAVSSVKYARRFTDDVEFSCEDAGRTPIDQLCFMVEAAIKAGASTINIPDTVGYTLPNEFAGILNQLFNRVPNIDQAIISVHCHDDLGLSVANSITALQQGARQVECTVNGLGERAGNCSLEEVAMIIETRKDQLGLKTQIQCEEIHRTSLLVSQICNTPVQSNKAIVGSNAFSHSSGIHQDGMLKSKNTYEIMSPEQIGLKANNMNLTSRSGRHVIKHRLAEMGYQEQDYNLEHFYQSFVELADKKGQVFDYDLEALMFFNSKEEEASFYELEYLNVSSGAGTLASATVKLKIGEESKQDASPGIGPVDSVYNAIERITGIPINIVDFKISAKGEGHNALGQVNLVGEFEGQRFQGLGLSTDIIEASAMAYLQVLNLSYRASLVSNKKEQIQREKKVAS